MKRDALSEEKLSLLLKTCTSFSGAHCFDVLPSTNDYAKQLAVEGENEGVLVLASCQTAGKGRLGRRFYSPDNSGLYMSLLLRPKAFLQEFGMLTACAAVAVHQAILELTGVSVDIKWVNDLYFNHKKFCGILAESQFTVLGQLDFVVLGVGINLYPPDGGYAEEIQGKTISLSEFLSVEKVPDKLSLCAAVTRHWFSLYNKLPDTSFLQIYRENSCVLGGKISYYKNEEFCTGLAESIDESARLVVRSDDGKKEILGTGEVNLVRLIL